MLERLKLCMKAIILLIQISLITIFESVAKIIDKVKDSIKNR